MKKILTNSVPKFCNHYLRYNKTFTGVLKKHWSNHTKPIQNTSTRQSLSRQRLITFHIISIFLFHNQLLNIQTSNSRFYIWLSIFIMLTQFEIKLLNLICRICGQSFTSPFCLENGRVSLKPNQSNLYLFVIGFLLISSLVSKTYVILRHDHDINNLILSTIFWLFSVAGITIQLNLWLYKHELIRLTNQISCINWFWS